MKYLQKLGKALMVPVAVLPAAGLLVGIGYAVQGISEAAGTIAFLNVIGVFIFGAGIAIIDFLPVLFAIGVAMGMSKGSTGAAGLAGFVAYNTVVVMLMPSEGKVLGVAMGAEAIVAFKNLANALTGIITGIIAGALYNKFNKTMLPSWLAFFNGKRLVPIMASFVAMLYVILMFFVWPVVFSVLLAFGNWLVGLSALGAGLFGFFNRLLIPTGLHHALNNIFWFDTIGIGDLTYFGKGQIALDNGTAIKGVTGMYQAGFFPIMMFGLPAAALAMIHTSKPENREKTKGIMISAAATAFVVGITEPIEFAFMFVAPVLYVIHAALTGISLAVAAMLSATSGFGFSAGAVDFVLSLFNPVANNPWILLIMGAIFAPIYYFLFRFLIVKYDMKTPGREGDGEVSLSE